MSLVQYRSFHRQTISTGARYRDKDILFQPCLSRLQRMRRNDWQHADSRCRRDLYEFHYVGMMDKVQDVGSAKSGSYAVTGSSFRNIWFK